MKFSLASAALLSVTVSAFSPSAMNLNRVHSETVSVIMTISGVPFPFSTTEVCL